MNGRQIFIQGVLMLLIGVASVAACLFYQRQLYFSMLFAGVVVLGIIVFLCYSLNRSHRMVQRMMEGIRYGDLTLNFTAKGKSRQEVQLVEDMNRIIADFRQELSEKEERSCYLDTLLDTVDSGLLVTDKEGQVLWMNRASIHDLCGHRIHRLSELDTLNKDFSCLLSALKPGEVKVLRIYKEEVMQDLAITVTEYATRGANWRLINVRNIRSVLEENEMEAWQKLVRVLTHEIMNSIAPIISLSESLSDRALNQGMEEDGLVLQGLRTIHRRSKGLLGFVENYRKLTRLSAPILAPVRVGDLLNDIRRLTPTSRVHYIYEVENEDRTLMLDRSQIEQVLLNLLKNAAEACAEQTDPEVVVRTSYQEEKRIFQLSISDNGCGILPDVLDKIFIPFFTTKPSGSGIGLSLCKQIMTLHGGSIQVSSEIGKGSCLTLKLSQ